MISIFDHLSSILIGTAVILILMVAQHRSSHASVEQVATHSVKAKTLVFGHWVERDILDLGKNLGRNRFRFKPPTTDSLGNTSTFHFYSDSTCTVGCSFPSGVNIAVGDTARLHTRYRLVPTKRANLRDTTGQRVSRQLMKLERDVSETYVNDGVAPDPLAGSWRRDRWTIGTLSSFNIEMLERDGRPAENSDGTVNIESGDYVFIRFSVVPEWILDPENYIREIYWSTTLKVRPYWEPPKVTT